MEALVWVFHPLSPRVLTQSGCGYDAPNTWDSFVTAARSIHRSLLFTRSLPVAIALVAWSGLVLQYVLLIDMTLHELGPWLGTFRFLSYFTVLSNVLVALTATFALRDTDSAAGGFFRSARVRGAAALCIAVTCGIYRFFLASTWVPQGLQIVADAQLHYIVPPLYLLWWIGWAGHGQLQWSDALRWLIFPLVFLIGVLARGAWLHEYPYPFLDVDTLGMAIVLRNVAGLGLLFLLAGGLLIAFDRGVLRRMR